MPARKGASRCTCSRLGRADNGSCWDRRRARPSRTRSPAGVLVTVEAAGPQAAIAETIRARGGDSLLAVKDNQPSLHDETWRLFDDPATKLHSRFETTDGDHGRIEVRRHWVSHDVDWLTTDRRFPREPRFPGVRAAAAVEAEVERGGSTSRQRRSCLSPLPLDGRLFAAQAIALATRRSVIE